MAALDQRPHLAEEEGQQQRADMRAVDVGVGHDDDLVVAQLVEVEVVAADAGAERGDQRADLLAADSILSKRARSTLRILPRSGSTAWNSRLRPCLAVPPAESPSTMKISDLAGIALLAIGELAGQAGDVERALAARQFARLARRLARLRRLDHLADDDCAPRADAPRTIGRAAR